MNRIVIYLFLFLSLAFKANAQKFLWNVDYHAFFDNREFKAPYQQPQTFFGTRLSAEIGLELKKQHQLLGGASWLQEFGAADDGFVDWRIYYQYQSSKIKTVFGSFSRDLLKKQYPDAIYRDSMYYFDHTINGAMIQYDFEKGYIEAFIDWQSRQTRLEREIFTLATSGLFQKDWFGGGWFFWLNHFAKPKGQPEVSLVDNAMLNGYVFADFRDVGFLDRLYIEPGFLISADRDRKLEDWQVPVGFLGNLILNWKWLEVEETIYAGGNQLPFYDKYGSELHYANPFFQASFYSDTRIRAYFIRNNFVECSAAYGLHAVGGFLQSQQTVKLKFFINQDDVLSSSWKNFFK